MELLELEKAEEILSEAIEKIEELYPLELTGHEILEESEEIVSREIIIDLCIKDISLQVAGWVELDRREPISCWFSGIIIIPELNLKLLGGYNNDERVIRMDYDINKKEWSNMYVDIL